MYRHKKFLIARRLNHLMHLKRLSLEIPNTQPTLSQIIQEMSAEEREEMKRCNPDLPDTLFMTQGEKSKHYRRTSRRFVKKLNSTPPRCSSSGKSVKFEGNLEIKLFLEEDRVCKIARQEAVLQPVMQPVMQPVG